MKQRLTREELEDAWTLGPDELTLLSGKRGTTRLGFAVILRFFAREGRFPAPEEIAEDAVECLAAQVEVPGSEYRAYDHRGRTAEYHRSQIREAFGFRPVTTGDADELAAWLLEEVAPYEYGAERLTEAAYTRLRSLKIEPPTPGRVDRLVRSSLRSYDERFCKATLERLLENSVAEMDALLSEPDLPEDAAGDSAGGGVSGKQSTLARLRNDPGRASAESARTEIAKLSRLREVGLPDDLFRDVSPKVVRAYRRRAASESPSSLRAHPPAVRYTLLSALSFMRLREVTDGLVEVLIQIVHKIGARSEKKIERVLLEDFKKVSGKNGLLFRVAEAALSDPDGSVREVVFPVVGEETLSKVVKEAKATGAAYQEQVQLKMRSSYVSYYRPVISAVLGVGVGLPETLLWVLFGTVLFRGARERARGEEFRAQEKVNARAARRLYEEGLGEGDASVVDDLVSEDFRDLKSGARGRLGMERVFSGLRRSYPDLSVSVEGQEAEGDLVRTRLLLSGTDEGGAMWYPPTGRRVSFTAEFADRFWGGLVVEHSGEADTAELLRQLGHPAKRHEDNPPLEL